MHVLLDFIENKQIQSFLDIGANIGDFSYNIKRRFPRINIFAIEANKNCEQDLLARAISYRITCLSDTKKKVNFYLSLLVDRKNTGASYFKEKTRFYDEGSYTTEVIETETLDDLFTEGFFEFIKLDTQGSELDILKGGVNLVRKASYLSVEVAVQEYNDSAPMKDDVFSYLESIGFIPEVMTEDHLHNGIIIQEDWIFRNVNI